MTDTRRLLQYCVGQVQECADLVYPVTKRLKKTVAALQIVAQQGDETGAYD